MKWIICKCGHDAEGSITGSEQRICPSCKRIGCWVDYGETCEQCDNDVSACTCEPKEPTNADE